MRTPTRPGRQAMTMKRHGMLAVAMCAALAGCAGMRGGDGWQTLIDGGKGLDNFDRLGTANWRAEPDALVADRRTGTEPYNYLATKEAYKDFQLRVEFWVSDDANSGVYMRCSEARPMTD